MDFTFQSLNDPQLILPALITFFILLFSSALFFYCKFRQKANIVLFVGLTGSGKTTLFTRLINPKNCWSSFLSLKENQFTNYATTGGKTLTLLDYPGSETFKKTLYQKWLFENRNLLKGVVFVLDSATFNKKDVAELLYDVLFELSGAVPVLVACNKQDIGHAKSDNLIKKALEFEFGLINVSREAALSSTSGESEKRILSKSGKNFVWTDLKSKKLDFVECTTQKDENYSLTPVREWINAV
uniref:Signal recognition particle receptor subunit beta n=1 Tax=Globodera pallida TaxID=36090 RepID=A0A183BJW3_GLOPA